MKTYSPGADFELLNNDAPSDSKFIFKYRVASSTQEGMMVGIIPIATGRVIYSDSIYSRYGNCIVLEHSLPDGEIIHSVYANLPVKPELFFGQHISSSCKLYGFILTSEINNMDCHLTFIIFRKSKRNIPFSSKLKPVDPSAIDVSHLGYPDKILRRWLQGFNSNEIDTALPVITDNIADHAWGQTPEDLIEQDNFFLVGKGAWHGGIHITDKQFNKKNLHPVLCLADGEIVAHRMTYDYHHSTYNGRDYKYSSNFCLVRHTLDDSNFIYSLYMHLRPLKHIMESDQSHNPAWLFSEVKAAIHDEIDCYSDPTGKDVNTGLDIVGAVSHKLKPGTKVTFDLRDIEQQKFNDSIVWAVRAQVEPNASSRFKSTPRVAWIHVDDCVMAIEKISPTSYINMLHEPRIPISVKAGDVIGFLGLHQHPGFGSFESTGQNRIHLELFSDNKTSLIDFLTKKGNWRFIDATVCSSLVYSRKSIGYLKEISSLFKLDLSSGEIDIPLLESNIFSEQKNGSAYNIAVKNKSEWHLSNGLAMLSDASINKDAPQLDRYIEHEKERVNNLCWMNLLRKNPINHNEVWHFHPFSLYSGLMHDTHNIRTIHERIKTAISIKGYVKELRYTHNTSFYGLMGMLASDAMMGAVEHRVNFRYGVDSRYAGGVTLVMSPKLNDLSHSIYDLYEQRRYLLGYDSAKHHGLTESELSEYYSCLHRISDFRGAQLSEFFPKREIELSWKKVQSSFKKSQADAEFKRRYSLSLVNAQMRVSWEDNHIQPTKLIELVIIAESLHKEIMRHDINEKLINSFGSFVTKIDPRNNHRGGNVTDLKKVSRSNTISYVVTALSKPSAPSTALKTYNMLLTAGKVKIIPDADFDIYSHKSGRLGKRSNPDGVDAMCLAAKKGLEFHDHYYDGEINNSPAAYSLEMLTEVEKIYFKHLLDVGCIMDRPAGGVSMCAGHARQ